ncbi:hypothetical protein VTO42DRAFT_6859 [Malbranchea cinnamomea]
MHHGMTQEMGVSCRSLVTFCPAWNESPPLLTIVVVFHFYGRDRCRSSLSILKPLIDWMLKVTLGRLDSAKGPE